MNCKELTELNVSGCFSLTDRSFEHLSEYGRRIEVLEMAELSHLEFLNFGKLGNIPNLKKINIASTKIDNLGLKSLVDNMNIVKNLECLNLASKNKIVFLKLNYKK